jgi:hypothetical protein
MNVNLTITESSDWIFKSVLKITPEDTQSAFELGRLFENIYKENKKCIAITSDNSIIIPLVERNEYNLPVLPNIDPDEPPF